MERRGCPIATQRAYERLWLHSSPSKVVRQVRMHDSYPRTVLVCVSSAQRQRCTIIAGKNAESRCDRIITCNEHSGMRTMNRI